MDEIKEYGQVKLDHNNNHKNIFLLSIIGEIEGHENVASLRLPNMNTSCQCLQKSKTIRI